MTRFGVVESDPPRDEAGARVSGDDSLFDAEGVEERDHVAREVLDPVARLRLVGVAMTALRYGDRSY